MFVDSDDMLAVDYLDAMMDAFRASDGDIVSSGYSNLSEDGRRSRVAETVRRHGAPWGRVFPREAFADMRFPEGYWFEDTVVGYCVLPRFRDARVNSVGYLYRKRGSSISHAACSRAKSIDSYWVTEEMLAWCRKLDVPLDQHMYERTLRQFGPLLYGRCVGALDEGGMRALFGTCAQCLRSVGEFEGMEAGTPGAWSDVEEALRTGDYALWRLACEWLGA